MSKVLIIGAGGVGTVVAHKVAKDDVFTDIMLASRTKSKCDQIANAIGGDRIKTAEVDADNVEALVTLMRSFEPDLVINVALPYQDLTIMDACFDRLAAEGEKELIAALLCGDKTTFELFRCEAPELQHLPAATYEWYEKNYLRRYYPIRYMLKFNGVRFPKEGKQ